MAEQKDKVIIDYDNNRIMGVTTKKGLKQHFNKIKEMLNNKAVA